MSCILASSFRSARPNRSTLRTQSAAVMRRTAVLQDLTHHLDQGQDESCEALLDTLRIRVDTIRERPRHRSELRREILTQCIVDIDGRLALVRHHRQRNMVQTARAPIARML
jgi:hypothetical protein